ncbi:unnamed protein product [Calypogeia fissa]
MAAASTVGLVPITRSFLAKYYDKYPYSPINGDLAGIEASLHKEVQRIDAERLKSGGDEHLVADLKCPLAHKIDENLWMNREQVEETLHLFDEANWPASLKAQDTSTMQHACETIRRLDENLRSLTKEIELFQAANSDRVYSMVLTYMPQDFRAALIKQQRERSEKRRQAEVDALMSNGGTIRDKYALLWKQQMERRKQLASLGSATGVYKQLVKLLVGVPMVLLDFVRQINDHHGPMEEQRERYGPPLYQITNLSNAIRIYTTVWWRTFDSFVPSTLELLVSLEKSVEAYVTDFMHYLSFMGEVFEHSPFLISAEEAGIIEVNAEEFKEAIIAAGKSFEVSVKVESEGSLVAWDFRLTSGKDVGFKVEFSNDSGSKLPILPYQRYELNQGDFYSPQVGQYTLIWDNSYSNFYRKVVRYKVDIIPSVNSQGDSMSDASSVEDEPQEA